MKKNLIFGIFALFSVLFLTGCGSSEKTINCTNKSDQSSSGYVLDSQYKIYASGDVVNKVETTETIESSNNTILSYFEKTLKEQYQSNNDKYGGYNFDITTEDGKLVSKVTVDYSKMDLAKFIEDNAAMKSFANEDNKLTVDGVKTMYESLGAICK